MPLIKSKPQYSAKEYIITLSDFCRYHYRVIRKLRKIDEVLDISEHVNGEALIINIAPKASIKSILNQLQTIKY